MVFTGTLVNAAAVVAGSLIGLAFHAKIPKKFTATIFQAIGLFTLVLGVMMALKSNAYLHIIFSLVLGAFVGELLNIEKKIHQFSNALKQKFKSSHQHFSEGFVTSFLLFCLGSMTILGAIEEGLGNPPNLLLAKSMLDGFSSIALAATLGVGVLFSVIPLLIYQGLLTFFAEQLSDVLQSEVINNLTAVGGILLVGLGINLLEIKNIKVTNMLPSLLVIIILSYFFK